MLILLWNHHHYFLIPGKQLLFSLIQYFPVVFSKTFLICKVSDWGPVYCYPLVIEQSTQPIFRVIRCGVMLKQSLFTLLKVLMLSSWDTYTISVFFFKWNCFSKNSILSDTGCFLQTICHWSPIQHLHIPGILVMDWSPSNAYKGNRFRTPQMAILGLCFHSQLTSLFTPGLEKMGESQVLKQNFGNKIDSSCFSKRKQLYSSKANDKKWITLSC